MNLDRSRSNHEITSTHASLLFPLTTPSRSITCTTELVADLAKLSDLPRLSVKKPHWGMKARKTSYKRSYSFQSSLTPDTYVSCWQGRHSSEATVFYAKQKGLLIADYILSNRSLSGPPPHRTVLMSASWLK